MSVTKRISLIKEITRIQQWGHSITSFTTLDEISEKLENLETVWSDFLKEQAAIEAISGKNEIDFQKIEGVQGRNLYEGAKQTLNVAYVNVSGGEPFDYSLIGKNIGGSSTSTMTTNPKPAIVTHTNKIIDSEIAGSSKSSNNNVQNKNTTPLGISVAKSKNITIAENGLHRVKTFATNAHVQNTSLALVRGHLGLLEQHWAAYMEASHLDENTTDEIHDDIAEMEILYIMTKGELEDLFSQFTTVTQTKSVPDVKLPRIELPKFNGTYESWTSFFDIFKSLVHNNKSLSGSQKLHYLKSSVEGEAAQLIRSYSITEANYSEAWAALATRYQNKRLIVNSHLKNILELPKLKLESASALRKLMDTFSECIRALNALDRPTDHWDDLLVFIFVGYMDGETRRLWELSLGDQMPLFVELRKFVETRCRSLEAAGPSLSNIRQPTAVSNHHKPRALLGSSDKSSCPICKENHVVSACPRFYKLYPGQRFRAAKSYGLCYNCLHNDHLTDNCTAPPCQICQRKHHSLLHYPERTSTTGFGPGPGPNPSVNVGVNSWNLEVLLSTATVSVETNNGMFIEAKVLLDSGSQTSFITERCFRKLQLVRKKASIPVSGLGNTSAGIARGYTHINIRSRFDDGMVVTVNALILDCITKRIPSKPVDKSKISIPLDMQLADPFFNEPQDVEILLGADVYGSIFIDGVIQTQQGITARQTIFGWVLSGPIIEPTRSLNFNAKISLCSHKNLENALRKFWEIESLEPTPQLSTEEQQCEQIFASTHSRDEHGRYKVHLPFNLETNPLGNSKRSAISSLVSLEKRFARQPHLRKDYAAFIDEYLSLGHMEPCTSDPADKDCFYLPHHPVLKQSTTTRLRVVFDASRQTHLGPSLNDKLLVGPKLQDDLVDILTRFRTYKYAFTSDIAKMYRQVLVEPSQCDFQRILWRDAENLEIKCFRLKTVTYGTASASYLATKALQQLAKDEADKFPLASGITLSDFYVDDLMSGSDSLHEALEIQKQLIALLEAGGMQLRKWASNCNTILQAVPFEHRECHTPLEIHKDESVKTLGMFWYPNFDYFGFKVDADSTSTMNLTKRIVLSQTAKLFDPLGFLAPVVISAKIFMQQLWSHGLDWDEQLPSHLVSTWTRYQNELPLLNNLQITRWLGTSKSQSCQLHGFCDSSEAAYGAAVYLRAIGANGSVHVNLIASKTRVAPVKKVCIPRLELCGASLLAKLLEHITRSIGLPDAECFAWTDSTVVLAWLQKPSNHWKTFVANRVSAIQSITSPQIWRHVPGVDNPADCASRGIFPAEIINHSLWWNGPSWLQLDNSHWPSRKNDHQTDIDERASNNISLLISITHNPLELLEKFSTLDRLKRVTAYIFRFFTNCRSPKSQRLTGWLTTLELTKAHNYWISFVQGLSFGTEIKEVAAGRPVGNKSVLKMLNPFLGADGLLRVGGRLEAAQIPYQRKHPIILSNKGHLIDVLISDFHIRNLHSGTQLTLSSMRQQYWVIGARNAVRAHIHRCVTCIRHRKNPGKQLMGNLPETRVTPSRPFLICGVDYAGPIILRLHAGRGNKTTKGYIALFVCFSTKAIHLELVSDLTTNAFLASFRRFTARRGKCTDIHSDCGTNFIGAQKELRELHAAIVQQLSDPQLGTTLANDGINWHFNPPAAPNMGGIWEAGVKSVKMHLRRIVGTTPMTFEEFSTVLTQIESCLNSRPLCQLNDDPNDNEALTPGHFLIGGPLNSLPDPSLDHLAISRLSRWQLCQKLVQHFWSRWRNEYLNTLQQRSKWWKTENNVKVGQLVLVIDDNQPPANWTLGRINEIFAGKDGLIRVASIKHKNGYIKRPISKLCLLPIM